MNKLKEKTSETEKPKEITVDDITMPVWAALLKNEVESLKIYLKKDLADDISEIKKDIRDNSNALRGKNGDAGLVGRVQGLEGRLKEAEDKINRIIAFGITLMIFLITAIGALVINHLVTGGL